MLSRTFGMRTALVVIASVAILATMTGCYDHAKDKRGRDARLNKLTGKLEVLQTDGKWATPEQEVAARLAADEAEKADRKAKLQDMPSSQVDKLRFTIGWFSSKEPRMFNFGVTNNSSWAISEIDIDVSIKDRASGKVLQTMHSTIRFHSIAAYYQEQITGRPDYSEHIKPNMDCIASTKLELCPADGQLFVWSISGIRGYPYEPNK